MAKSLVRVGVIHPEKYPCQRCGAVMPWYTVANADHSVHTPVSFRRDQAPRNDRDDDNESWGWLGLSEYRYFPAQVGDISVSELMVES